MKTLTDMKTTRAFGFTCTVLLGLVFSMPVTAEEASAAAYTMAVIENEAFGRQVTAGKYERAIDRIREIILRRGDPCDVYFSDWR